MNVNTVVFGGRLGHEPEVKPAGESRVAKFSLANTKKIKGNDVTIWMDVEAWGKTADLIEKHVHKGDGIIVVGELSVSNWEKDGVKKSRTFIKADKIVFGTKAKPKDEKPKQAIPEGFVPDPEPDGGPQPDQDIPF